MRKWLLMCQVSGVMCHVLVFSGCAAQTQLTAPAADVGMALDPYAWDFGRIKKGLIAKHEFIFKNETKDKIKITDITTSCGCTASKAGKAGLLPGEETAIEVSFNSKGFSGPVQQFVYVHTDSLDKAVFRFIIKADVER
ncbi:MAG: DUF1573 domain-containing protein [Candidatus Omnitrophota bacterium]